MRKFALFGVTVLVGASLAFLLWPGTRPHVAAPPLSMSTSSSSVMRARAEAARARDRAAALDREARAATRASERAVIEAAALASRVQQAEAALASADAGLALVQGQRGALERSLARERSPVAQLLAGLQTQVRQPALLTLLQPGTIEDAVHLRAMVATIGPQIEARTAVLRGDLARAGQLERTASQMVADRRALQAELRKRRGELAALSAAEQLKARRAGEAADREAERAFAIGEQSRDLSTLVRGLDQGKRAQSRSVGTAAAAELANYRPPLSGMIIEDARGGAYGVAISARPGALVVAPGAGRVAFAGPYRGFGDIVIIEHEGGWTSLLTGLARSDVAVGQLLVAGSAVGRSPANTARIGWELRRNGQRVSPLDQIR